MATYRKVPQALDSPPTGQDTPPASPRRASGGQTQKIDLKRRFTLRNGVAICMGLMMGISMYVSPTGVIRGTHSGGLALVVWVLCGLVNWLGALVFSELATTFPRSGHMYVYLEEFYGPFAAFIFLWEYYLFHRSAANAIKCLTFANYVLKPIFVTCAPPLEAVKLVAILVACVITFMNITDMKLTTRAQSAFVAGTALSFCFLIAVAIYHAASGGKIYLDNLFDNINKDFGDIVMSFYSGLFAYGGWEGINFLVEEVHNPERVLPLSICIALALVTVFYCLVNLSYQMVLGAEGIMMSEAVAGSMLEKVIGGGSAIMAVLITFNTAGSFNSGVLIGSRLGYASAKRGHLPTILSLVHTKYFTPITSLLLQLSLIVICCIIGDIFFILNNVVFAYSLFQAMTVSGYIWHRIKFPNYQRPLKIPLVVGFAYILCQLLLLAVPLVTKPLMCAVGIAFAVGTSLPYYFLFIWHPFNLSWFYFYTNKLLVFTQKLFNAAIPDSARIH